MLRMEEQTDERITIAPGVEGRITEAREAVKLTPAELSRELGLTRSAVSQWEAGITKPSGTNLVALARRTSFEEAYIIEAKLPKRKITHYGHRPDREDLHQDVEQVPQQYLATVRAFLDAIIGKKQQ